MMVDSWIDNGKWRLRRQKEGDNDDENDNFDDNDYDNDYIILATETASKLM